MIVITTLNIVVVFIAYLARLEKHRYLLVWAFILLILVLGIRYGYGNDFFNYKYIFKHGAYEAETGDEDYGWLILNRVFFPIGFSSLVFFLTVLEHLMLYDLIRRYVSPHYYWLALFIYLFNPYFMLIGLSMMRQFLVQILGFYVIEYVYKRKFIHFAALIIVCVSIHKIGLLLIPLALFPFASRISYGKKTILLFTVIGVFSFFFLITRMDSIIEGLIEFFAEYDMKYGNSYLNASAIGEEERLNPKMLLRYAIYVFLLIRNFKFLSETNASRYFAIVVIFGTLFIPFATISQMAMRVSWIYSFVVIVALPLLLREERIPIIKYGSIFFILILLLREYEGFFISEIYSKYYANFHTIFSEYAIYDITMY